MKSSRFFALTLILALSIAAFAQGRGPGGGPPRMPSVDDRVNMLSKHLNLSDDQKPKVRSIIQTEQDQMKQMMQDSSLSQQDRRSKMMSLHQTTTQQISAVLNDEQKKKYQEMQDKMRQHMQERRGMRQGGPDGPGGQSDKQE